jgi:carboxyl-terminal processing protease
MKQPLRSMFVFTSCLILALGSGYFDIVFAEKAQEREDLPLKELRTFAEVFGRIKSDYVESVDDKELLESAIRGMLGGLDPHSSYLDEEEYRDLQVGTRGEFGGLGIEVGMEDGFVKVIAPIDDTPAQRAGLKAGDLIIRIDDKPVKGMGLDDAVNIMRGKPGTKISLTILREGAERPFDVELVRDVIHVASVKSRLLEPGFGYVRISHFQSRTTEDLLSALSELAQGNSGALEGLVLDLRNNPGGVLNSAVGVSDAFLVGGKIVYTKGRVEDSELQFKAGPDDVLKGAPIVVLVNGGSASASEIVAGALQDHKRAIVMGSPTFGKGSVQTIVPIDNTTALKLTTARYYTPLGRSIQAHGIKPDIELADAELQVAEEPNVGALKEADLRRHLGDDEQPDRKDEAVKEKTETKSDSGASNENPDDESGKGADQEQDTEAGDVEKKDAAPEKATKDGAEKGETEKVKPLLSLEDYQLGEALNVLKGLAILGRRKDG